MKKLLMTSAIILSLSSPSAWAKEITKRVGKALETDNRCKTFALHI